jgi:hypothetical protein
MRSLARIAKTLLAHLNDNQPGEWAELKHQLWLYIHR